MRPIIKDVPMTRGRVVGGIVRAQVTTGTKWRARAEASEARVIELEALLTTREAHM